MRKTLRTGFGKTLVTLLIPFILTTGCNKNDKVGSLEKIGNAQPAYGIQNKIMTNEYETNFLNRIANDVITTGEIAGFIKSKDKNKANIPHRIKKIYSKESKSLSVVVYDHNQNRLFDQGDEITIDDLQTSTPFNTPSFKKRLLKYEVIPSSNEQLDLDIAKGRGQVVSSDPNFDEKSYRKKAGIAAEIRTKRIYKNNLNLLEQAFCGK
ncbi:MAG TPA: hypothetical protein VMV95_04185 [Bacillota bacterium]|nr:hypothetical protein [Bacillota bacterium]